MIERIGCTGAQKAQHSNVFGVSCRQLSRGPVRPYRYRPYDPDPPPTNSHLLYLVPFANLVWQMCYDDYVKWPKTKPARNAIRRPNRT